MKAQVPLLNNQDTIYSNWLMLSSFKPPFQQKQKAKASLKLTIILQADQIGVTL
jgi:hypothetical protein